MSRVLAAGLFSLALVSLSACTDAPVSPGVEPALSLARAVGGNDVEQVVPGEVLVKFKSTADAETKARGKGLGILRKGFANAFMVVGTSKGNEHALANSLKGDADVEWAEPNYLRQADAVDPRLWAFYNPGGLNMSYSNGSGPIPSSYASTLDADEDNIQNYAATGANVVVGSIDTGVDLGHSEFTGRLIQGTDWINGGTPQDEDGHGTHTTGTIAGSSVGVAGVSGAASHVKVYVQRVCGPSGCPTSAIINAINEAAAYTDASGKRLVAVNMSLGGIFRIHRREAGNSECHEPRRTHHRFSWKQRVGKSRVPSVRPQCDIGDGYQLEGREIFVLAIWQGPRHRCPGRGVLFEHDTGRLYLQCVSRWRVCVAPGNLYGCTSGDRHRRCRLVSDGSSRVCVAQSDSGCCGQCLHTQSLQRGAAQHLSCCNRQYIGRRPVTDSVQT